MQKYKLLILSLLICHLAFAGNQKEEQLSLDVQANLHSSIINPIEPHLVFKTKSEGIAWLNDMSNRLKAMFPKNPLIQDQLLRQRLLTMIQYESVRAGLDPQLVLSLITVESRFDKYAISSVGALGLMQVMPFWQRQIGTSDQNLFDLRTNLRYGCTILRYYLQLEHNDLFYALGRYNGSRGLASYPDKIFNAYRRYWQPASVVSLNAKGKLAITNYNN